MDILQLKLTKSEWQSIEIPISTKEKEILEMIISGFNDINIIINTTTSLLTFIKIEKTDIIERFIFNKYFKILITKLIQTYDLPYIIPTQECNIKLNSADTIRINNNNQNNMIEYNKLYEFILITKATNLLLAFFQFTQKEKQNNNSVNSVNSVKSSFKEDLLCNYYTLIQLLNNNITNINKYVINFLKFLIVYIEPYININDVLKNACYCIEQNTDILKYADKSLYAHQKKIFSLFQINSSYPNLQLSNNSPNRLVLYMAPTGTGKTITPIALSNKYRIIFVCAVRHVGMALARSAISMKKKVAFAFGCNSAEDIRLHNYAASVYITNIRTGGIGKIDNSFGEKVEIMICDIQSYISAMHYMLSFNDASNIIMFWDEPTITLDYETHPIHPSIQRNWNENLIPNIILSSATLPTEIEINDTISHFHNKFGINSKIHSIISQECQKSISLINPEGLLILPHNISNDYNIINEIATTCLIRETLMRYFDLGEVVRFIFFITNQSFAKNSNHLKLERYFENITDINIQNIKKTYLLFLQNIPPDEWNHIYNYFISTQICKIITNPLSNTIKNTKSIVKIHSVDSIHNVNINENEKNIKKNNGGTYITTLDAYTLTDGPTIYLTDDIIKITKFCIQQANIPNEIMKTLMDNIYHNNIINKKIAELEKEIENIEQSQESNTSINLTNSSSKGIRKYTREISQSDKKIGDISNTNTNKKSTIRITSIIHSLHEMGKHATLNTAFIPNSINHLKKWASNLFTQGAFTSSLDENTVYNIMMLADVDDSWKILLLLGIGIFMSHKSLAYMEIMKQLADEQKLYLIIAGSDFIYGTNYQFCHAYLAKDLNLTQEKIIQSMGRVGRNNIQQTYSIRFRDNLMIERLFIPNHTTISPEIINMNRLFNSYL